MSALWTAAEAARATGGRTAGAWQATGVSIDTRTLAPGDLFVALAAQRDGHEFVARALELGAAAALVSHVPEGVSGDAPLLVADDTLAALTALGAVGRARTRARVVAVTGSVGKTSTKDMLRTALAAQAPTHAADKSYNNHWGVPLTLARMPRDTRFAVIEIGMNRPGEIAPLARLARPHVGIVTTVAAAHMESFGSLDEIAREKASLAEGLVPGGVMILNRDTGTYPVQRGVVGRLGVRCLSFGGSALAHYRLSDTNLTETAVTARAACMGAPQIFKLAQPGRHLAMNAMAVLAAVDALGADRARAALALAGWSAPEGRGARWIIALGGGGIDGHVHLIDESYNANPAAMAAAFEVFAVTQPRDGQGRVARGRRIALLADMLELGADGPALHAQLAALPALAAVDTVHCAGPLMKHLHAALPHKKRGLWCADSAALAARVPRLVDAGDVVMCKGSNGSRVGLLVQAIKKLGDARPLDAQGTE
ncbi:UDP-N-acetylmuramoyl-tripeptide--D-alanyl-D-alanine ligase [Rhodobacteraceae bacterium 2CG4]|uniref:UDP-N-acetylmuramoyl-tripeptide--D-alanyl-D-alanine ligase n=1 Tax=Halovulum marinum TaxID=2662447 RepID=A0A6L5Z175_9RHOB|nr:UDP-N-acetylmuramoyl-tripeptide--D-alanyl-D-alanine ligase [Halovulum marinum]MSU89805.1 UDP-N-acetylmuramoyl-tripeptide--D-alanyl-D-alanine ligase [Halovulum marinum]